MISNSKRDGRLSVRDLSSLQFDETSGHLLALSDESKRILELDTSGHPIGSSSLAKGSMGLSKGVPQAEGMAMDAEGTLYLVSEPNLFYVFRKP
ncbi:SdiA-regulated [Pseudomonas syringae pv. cilantro]|uniref:SdiA-regulated n=1 Tax=Pseudomonas syringae pv. cilantro TaxID=81035 RepID=A0A0N0GCN8_PSESX|nr:SdiA-regulated [Pseudomonas syringae pv. cilantro]